MKKVGTVFAYLFNNTSPNQPIIFFLQCNWRELYSLPTLTDPKSILWETQLITVNFFIFCFKTEWQLFRFIIRLNFLQKLYCNCFLKDLKPWFFFLKITCTVQCLKRNKCNSKYRCKTQMNLLIQNTIRSLQWDRSSVPCLLEPASFTLYSTKLRYCTIYQTFWVHSL